MSRLSKVRAGITVSVRIKVSLVLVIGWRYNFLTLSEWSCMLGSRHVATAKIINNTNTQEGCFRWPTRT